MHQKTTHPENHVELNTSLQKSGVEFCSAPLSFPPEDLFPKIATPVPSECLVWDEYAPIDNWMASHGGAPGWHRFGVSNEKAELRL